MAGSAYDVSTSNAKSAAQAANQNASTVFNFSSPGSWFGGTDQTAVPTSSATAATKSPGAGSDILSPGVNQSNWPLLAIAGGVLAVLALLILRR